MPDILIADDEKEIVRLLKIYLETDGVNVFEANDGAQALEIIESHVYESAWYDSGAVDDNTIHVIISRLRDKVGASHIKTIRGLGYRFEE